MVLADLCLATERRLNAMEQQKVTINELVKRLTDEMLRIGYSKQTIYRNFIPNMMHVVHFYEATGTVYYSPASSAEYLSYNIERCKRGEITDHYVRQIRSTILRWMSFYYWNTSDSLKQAWDYLYNQCRK